MYTRHPWKSGQKANRWDSKIRILRSYLKQGTFRGQQIDTSTQTSKIPLNSNMDRKTHKKAAFLIETMDRNPFLSTYFITKAA
jgi:hypothetical protein